MLSTSSPSPPNTGRWLLFSLAQRQRQHTYGELLVAPFVIGATFRASQSSSYNHGLSCILSTKSRETIGSELVWFRGKEYRCSREFVPIFTSCVPGTLRSGEAVTLFWLISFFPFRVFFFASLPLANQAPAMVATNAGKPSPIEVPNVILSEVVRSTLPSAFAPAFDEDEDWGPGTSCGVGSIVTRRYRLSLTMF